MPHASKLSVWQWNCRGYGRKQSALSLYIAQQDSPPAAILLQELNMMPIKLKDYITYQQDQYTATLVHKQYTAILQDSLDVDTSHCHVTILPIKRGAAGIHILNVYSPPKDRNPKLAQLIRGFLERAKKEPAIIGGDFNAPHPSWGYPSATPKGRKLEEAMNQEGLTLLTDIEFPTRLGNSVSRDTCPDLTMVRNVRSPNWKNLDQHLGSDHYILMTEFDSVRCKRKIGEARITEWDKWRESRANKEISIQSIEEWTRDVVEEIKSHTKIVNTTEDTPAVDSRLLHIWEARRALTRRWKRQKHNKKLKRRIEVLNREAESYAISLTKQNWNALCDQIRGKLSVSKTWKLLRALIDPNGTRTATQDRLNKLIHLTEGSDEEVIKRLADKYLCTDPPEDQPDYEGEPNEELDRPITTEELRAELTIMKKTAAPGPDSITARHLFNLDDDTIAHLVEHFNREYWDLGITPPSWKKAEIRFIPKPNKVLKLENLRPISLTSCLGKLFERVINTRLTKFVEKNSLLANTQFGFRPHMSTQDILLWVYKDLLEKPTRAQTRCILALDLKGAFDNVLHRSILKGLTDIGCGQKTYRYIRSFLTTRQATISLGNIKSEPITLGSKGTPQGAVLSPLLFNLAMRDLPAELDNIPGIRHAIYADDITVWCRTGSDAEVEESLQRAADVVEAYAKSRGLQCASEKSALLILKNPRKETSNNIQVHISGELVPRPNCIKILGQHIPQGTGNGTTIKKLGSATEQVLRMIRRIRNKRHGLGEREATRLVQAFVVPRIIYGTAYLRLTKGEVDKLNIQIRKAYKTALGIPNSTSTIRLLELGVHNTVEELWEAQKIAQIKRLNQTPNGKWLLEQLGITIPGGQPEPLEDLTPDIRAKITVSRIPRNMHPIHNAERRRARAESLGRLWDSNRNTLYVDAAGPQKGRMVAAVTTPDGGVVNSATLKTKIATQGEEAAIALAIASNPRAIILTDSQEACRHFIQGNVFKSTYKILCKHPPENVLIIWTPGHTGQKGNEAADATARGLLIPAPLYESPSLDMVTVSFSEYLSILRLNRRIYPPPDKSLTKEEEHTLRRLQTDTLPTLSKLHSWYPTLYSPFCPHCRERADAYHTVWACQYTPTVQPITNTAREQWEAILRSDDPACQRWLVGRATAALEASGTLQLG